MKYNGLFVVPKPAGNKTAKQTQPEKTTAPCSDGYREGFREGFQTGWRKRFEYESAENAPLVVVTRRSHPKPPVNE